MVAFTATAGAFLFGIFAVAGPRIDRFQNARPVLKEIYTDSSGKNRIAAHGYLEPSFVFYGGSRIERLQSREEVSAFLKKPGHYLLTTDRAFDRLQFPNGQSMEALVQMPRFLKPDELVTVFAGEWTPKPGNSLEEARRRSR